MLRVDLMGIGIMIFTMTLTLLYTAYYAHTTIRDWSVTILFTIMIFNFVVQLTPCYANPELEKCRVIFYFGAMCISMFLALLWVFYIGTSEEVHKFSFRLFSSFVYLGIGFYFYSTKWPES